MWCHSRALKPSYKGLPPLYLEVIGHHWAITDDQFYLKGMREPFEAVTDHYALVALTNKSLADLTVKLKELFLKLRPYNYYTTHIAGAGNIVSDALSRAVCWSKKPDVEKEEEAFEEGVKRVFARKVMAQEKE